MKLEVTTESKDMILLDFVVTENEIQELSVGETTYFQLKEQ